MTTIHAKLKWLRENSEHTQKEIANLLGTTQQHYSTYENGKHSIPLEHIKTLCVFYNISADYLLGLPEGLPYPKKR